MALFSERMLSCAQRVLDTADTVRDSDFIASTGALPPARCWHFCQYRTQGATLKVNPLIHLETGRRHHSAGPTSRLSFLSQAEQKKNDMSSATKGEHLTAED
jgi:hypothetical protein